MSDKSTSEKLLEHDPRYGYGDIYNEVVELEQRIKELEAALNEIASNENTEGVAGKLTRIARTAIRKEIDNG